MEHKEVVVPSIVNMAPNSWTVDVYLINHAGEHERKFEQSVRLKLDYDPQGLSLQLNNILDDKLLLEFPVHCGTECCRISTKNYVFHVDDETLLLKFASLEDCRQFHIQITKVKSGKSTSVFSIRTEDSSATQYFQFYGYLSQQQNMLQDFVRTSTYQRAILCNLADFKDKIVLDVGAGSGILSFFAAQAGAKRVYAVEASTMAHFAQKLVSANNLQHVVKVIPGKIEEICIPESVDIVVSEPMGYMLYNERMLETYLHAKKWLKTPGGKMFPSRGDLHIAPFTDDALYMEQFGKANFWFQTCFHGVNLSAIQSCAIKEYFRQPIVDTFDARICLSKSVRHVVDFLEASETDLHTIDIPVEFQLIETGTCHGLAFWFDVAFIGTDSTVWLSTAPTEPLTHWYQVRCLLEEPILVKRGQVLRGRVLLVANKRQSYDVTIELHLDGTTQRSSNTLDLKNPYFRYTGAPVQPPPGTSNLSPSEHNWQLLDAAQGVRNAVNMVNGMSVNGLADVTMDTNPAVIPNQLIANNLIGLDPAQLHEVPAPNIHPGCISSTGRGRIAASPTSTPTAQLIGGAMSPSLFTTPTVQQMQVNAFAILLFCLLCRRQTSSYSVTRNSNDYRTTNTGEVITSSNKPEASPSEPSCEELKAMWRFSKRQSRAAEMTNEIPTYRDPFSVNVWEPYAVARSRSMGGMRLGYRSRPTVYGRLVHKPSLLRIPDIAERHRAFEQVARTYGTMQKNLDPPRRTTAFRLPGGDRIHHLSVPPQTGSFQHLKELIRTERARELQEQRRAEEAAARNEALKELARNNHRSRMNKFHMTSYDYDPIEMQRDEPIERKALLTFPDLLAPSSARFEVDAVDPNDVDDDYVRERPATKPQRLYYRAN